MNENDEITVDTEQEEDSTEALLEEYDNKRLGRADDAAAMQSVMCIIISALLFGANMIYPEIAGGLLNRITALSAASKELFPNPINFIEALIDKL
jgi:hypothetical protein rflaF_18986